MNPDIKCSTGSTDNAVNVNKLYWCLNMFDINKYNDSKYPINANTKSSCGSNGKSVVKSVAKTAVTVSAFWNHTAKRPVFDKINNFYKLIDFL